MKFHTTRRVDQSGGLCTEETQYAQVLSLQMRLAGPDPLGSRGCRR